MSSKGKQTEPNLSFLTSLGIVLFSFAWGAIVLYAALKLWVSL